MAAPSTSLTTVLVDDLWPLKAYREYGADHSEPYVLVYAASFDHAFEMARVDDTAALLAHDLAVVEAELYRTRLLAVEPA